MPTLDATSVSAAAVTRSASITTGIFWTISGIIDNNAVSFDPLFTFETEGPISIGSGSHRIEIYDASGEILYVRFFNPSIPVTETPDEDLLYLPVFFELVPVQANATQIVILDPTDAIIGALDLDGAPPVVSIIYPAGGEVLSGVKEIAWSINDPDSTVHTARVDYSSDGGQKWMSLGQVKWVESLKVNFDTIPGSFNSSVVRVSISDGVNTDTSISKIFSVSRKTPSVQITNPELGMVFRKQDLVWLRGYAYDEDDGYLKDEAVRWESDSDGFLGTGTSLPITTLSEGQHEISMIATDSDGNIATQSTTIVVAGLPPTLDLTVEPLDVLPTTCVQVTIDAQAGPESVDLSTVEYSLNGGETWNSVPLDSLPFKFLVPGEGFFHFVARAFDVAGQVAAADDRFFIDSECQTANQPPTAQCQEVTVPTEPGVCTAPASIDSGSYDPDGDPITLDQSPPGPYDLGPTEVTLTVTDDKGASDSCTAIVTVEDLEPPAAQAMVPNSGEALQDGVTFEATASDNCGVDAVSFSIQEPGGTEVMALDGHFDEVNGKWKCDFNTTSLPDGYYVLVAKAVDASGNEGLSEAVSFSIRNWAVLELLPSTKDNKAGRTMPVKFALRIVASVDPAMPFVRNEDLEIRICGMNGAPVYQSSYYGDTSTDYRIGTELYITNFKTFKQTQTYQVQIWRPSNSFKVGEFTFSTTK